MVSKKIQKTDKGQSLRSYAYSVIEYVTNPDSAPDPETGKVNKGEKCVAIETNCLYDNTVKGIVNEIVDSINERDAESGSQPIVHRVISLQKDERLSERQLFDACHDFMKDLGYTEAHQYAIAIHNDTDNLHVHIVSNRYNTLDGSLLEEGNGWDELESRRACVRLEKKLGLAPEPGSRFVATEKTETVPHTNPFTGEVTQRERFCIEQVRKEKPGPDIRDRARWGEMKTGLKSQQRVMQEIFGELRPQLSDKMNFGQFYKALAEKGVQAELVKHGSNSYLTYSLDGEHWEKPSEIHPDFSAKSLETILNSRVRKPREELTDIVKTARQSLEEQPTKETTMKMTYSKEQIVALRTIPVSEVRQSFDLPDTDNKKVKNGVDALVYQGGKPYAEAVQALAEKFPGVISGEALVNSIDQNSIAKRLEIAGVPESLRRTGTDCLRQLDAWGAERFHVYGNAPDRNFSSAQGSPQGWTKEEVLQNLAFLAKMNMDGGHIYIDPQYNDDKIKIPVDDVQQGFINNYRPSMVINTSREKKQAHYVVDRKYDKEFYDILTENINYKWGDPKIKTADHDSRLAGFTNRKPAYEDENGNFPFVKVEQSTPVRCIDFERYVDEQYILYKQGKLKHLNPEKKISNLSNQHERDEAMKCLSERTLPTSLTNRAIAYQAKLRMQYGKDIDRSKADFMTADLLYRQQATPEQVYTFLKHNALQDDDLVTRRHQDGTEYKTRKNVSDSQKDRHARRTAVNAYFDKGHAIERASLPDLTQAMPTPRTVNRWQHEQATMPAPTPAPVIDQGTRTKELEKQAQAKADEAAAKAKAEAEAAAKAAEEARIMEERKKAEEDRAARAATRPDVKAMRERAQEAARNSRAMEPSNRAQGSSPGHNPRLK